MFILNTNLKVKSATTQYTDLNLNSVVKYGDKYFAASEDGLIQFGGDDDYGTPISSFFLTSTMDFGIGNDKRLRYIYLSLEATADLILEIYTEKVSAQVYPVIINSAGQQDIRITVSKILHGRFWTFKISNGSSGADFSIDEIKVLPIIRNLFH